MSRRSILTIVIAGLVVLGAIAVCGKKASNSGAVKEAPSPGGKIELPAPKTEGPMSVEEALSKRRSVRDYSDEPLSLEEISQILWAAQGITSPRGFRTAPSAGALYPIELYIVVSKVEGLTPGIYYYDPHANVLEVVKEGDFRKDLCNAGLGQRPILDTPVNLVITAVYERTMWKYGKRATRYVRMEAGHVAQNVYLQAQTLGLGTVSIGAFYDDRVKKVLEIEEDPLYIMPIGKR